MIVYDTGVLIEERFEPEGSEPVGVTALSLAELEFGVSVAAADIRRECRRGTCPCGIELRVLRPNVLESSLL